MDKLKFGDAVKRGLKRRCPHCESPTLFTGYLGVRDRCPQCGAENGRHRVDDIASYFTVLLVGHILIGPALAIPVLWMLPLWASVTVMLLLVAGATLALLPYIKGGVIGALAATSQTST